MNLASSLAMSSITLCAIAIVLRIMPRIVWSDEQARNHGILADMIMILGIIFILLSVMAKYV